MAGKGQDINKIADLAGKPRPAPGSVENWEPSAESKAEMERLASSVEKGEAPASRVSSRSTKGQPAKKEGEGGRRRRTRRHTKKHKKSRRHHRKH